MQNLLQMNQSSSENQWCHRWPNNCISHRKFTVKDKLALDIIPISDSVHVKTLVPAPIQWQVQHTGWRKKEGSRAGQGRRDRECTNTQHFTNDYWPVYMHIPSLPNAVTSILCLSIHGGVPVTVIENNGVCTCQIDANTAWPCRKDEAEDALVSIEAIHQCL